MLVKNMRSTIEKLKSNPLGELSKLNENEIASVLKEANQKYYNTDKSIFSDDLYDIIKEYLAEKYPNHPILGEVGAEVDGREVKLPYYIGSLDKIKQDGGGVERFIKKYGGTYIVSDKLDGRSGIVYVKDSVVHLYSRGNAVVGSELSHNIPYLKAIPKKIIENLSTYENLCVRGELIISKENYDQIKTKGKNARSMVAILKSKHPDLEILKHIDFVAYEILYPVMRPEEQFIELERLGFKTVWHKKLKDDMNDKMLSEILENRRIDSEYNIDGLVVLHNSIHERRTDRNPEYAFAYKAIHSSDRAEVIVTDVEWNISKDGYLVPIVTFSEVNLNGYTNKRAYAHNAKYIYDNNIGPGARIIVIRAGAVIPQIESVITVSETGKPHMPNSYTWNKSGTDIVDLENEDLPYKILENFVKKLEIKGIGPGIVRKSVV